MSSVISLWDWILAQDPRFHIVFGLSVFLVLTSLSLFVYVLQLRNRRNLTHRLSEELLLEIEPLILDLVYSEEDEEWPNRTSEIRSILNVKMFEFHSYGRVSDYLVLLHKQMDGEAAEKIERLYREIGLPDKTIKLLKEGPWHQKVKAISALGEFKVRRYLFEVIQFMDHPKRLVRDEAQFTAIVLGGKKAVKSIAELSNSISKWQQLRLQEECVKIGDAIKEDVFSWLSSKNETLVELSLRISIGMGWYEVLLPVSQLIGHRREEIRKLSVRAVAELGTPDMLTELVRRFEVESRSVQMEIIYAITELDLEGALENFLVSQVAYGQLELALGSARALYEHNDENELARISMLLPESRRVILEHVKYA